MYSFSNLILYSEKSSTITSDIHNSIFECNIAFKEVSSLKFVLSAIKSPQYYIILIIKNKMLLQAIEKEVKYCYNFQNRIFVVFENQDDNDYFFQNFCIYPQLDPIKIFIKNNISIENISPPHQPSSLLTTLIEAELQTLGISKKYIGFQYLLNILTNALTKNFYCSYYINLFEYISNLHNSTIDTIERDVRHMLLTTWKQNEEFRQKLQKIASINNPNSKTILNAILEYIKKAI